MSILKIEDSKKWIHAFMAIIAVLVSYLTIQFMGQLGEWFDLEARVSNYILLSQGLGIFLGIATFVMVIRRKSSFKHMEEVYSELVKSIWPDKDSTFKSTFGIVVALAIVSGIFVGVDFIFSQFLKLLY